jgi:cation transport regulator ChaC
MSHDTIAINRQMNKFDGHASVWLFGYGSLIFKPDFPFLEKRAAFIRGWTRRFWQGSHDHRGTETAPGRVVTLVPDPDAVCHGMAFLVTPEEFVHLDHREKNGYLRLATQMQFDDGSSDEGTCISPRTTTQRTWARPMNTRLRARSRRRAARAARTAITFWAWRSHCARWANPMRTCSRSSGIWRRWALRSSTLDGVSV